MGPGALRNSLMWRGRRGRSWTRPWPGSENGRRPVSCGSTASTPTNAMSPPSLSFPGTRTVPITARWPTSIPPWDAFSTVSGARDGRTTRSSYSPATMGKPLASREIYFESLSPHFSRGWAPLRGIISGRQKYFDSPIPELYDIDKDFGELDNLAGGRGLDAVRAALKKTIDTLAPPSAGGPGKKLDRAAQERTRHLGYVSGPGPPS